MSSVKYYEENADTFYKRTINVEMKDQQNKFLSYLASQSHILDAGCGVGRDTKYFLQKGYNVSAFDASAEMVNYARKETGINVEQKLFQKLDYKEFFDGIWACASLLHVPYKEMRIIMEKIHLALKPAGIFYASFKYGPELMSVEGRDFFNMTEVTILPYIEGLYTPLSIWRVDDLENQKAWLNFIVKKIN